MRTHTQCIWWGPLSNNDIVYNILTCKAIILFWQQQQQKKHKNCEMTKLKDYDYDMRIVQSLKAMVDAHTKNQEIKFNMHINKIRIPHLNGDGKEKYLYTVSEKMKESRCCSCEWFSWCMSSMCVLEMDSLS